MALAAKRIPWMSTTTWMIFLNFPVRTRAKTSGGKIRWIWKLKAHLTPIVWCMKMNNSAYLQINYKVLLSRCVLVYHKILFSLVCFHSYLLFVVYLLQLFNEYISEDFIHRGLGHDIVISNSESLTLTEFRKLYYT